MMSSVYLSLLAFCVTVTSGSDRLRNLAFGKPAYSASARTFETIKVDAIGDPGYAVDEYPQTTCAFTEKHEEPWVMIDLEEPYLITDVSVYISAEFDKLPETIKDSTKLNPNQTNKRYTWIQGVYLSTFSIKTAMFIDRNTDTLIDPSLCYNQTNAVSTGEEHVFRCNTGPLMARYVRLSKKEENPTMLLICDFQVYGVTNVRYLSPSPRRERKSLNPTLAILHDVSTNYCIARCIAMFPRCTSVNKNIMNRSCELIADQPISLHGNETTDSQWNRYTLYEKLEFPEAQTAVRP